jgi:hypothetical protein
MTVRRRPEQALQRSVVEHLAWRALTPNVEKFAGELEALLPDCDRFNEYCARIVETYGPETLQAVTHRLVDLITRIELRCVGCGDAP